MAISKLFLLLIAAFVHSEDSKFCDSHQECKNIQINNDLFCRGYESCASTSIEISTADAYCLGSFGCSDTESFSASNIYCYGDTACANANNIIAIDGSITCSGISSCVNVIGDMKANQNIICAGVNSCSGINGNIKASGQVSCSGQTSCMDIKGIISGYIIGGTATDSMRNTIIHADNKAYFSGSYSGSNSQITSGGNIECDGPYSCAQSKLSATDDVRLFGYGAGYKASIKDSLVIYCYGYYAVAYSDIYAVNNKKKVTQIKLYGHYSGYYSNVWCDTNSVCSIFCKGTGCLETNIFYENDINIVTIEPINCLHNQGESYNDIMCPTLVKYTKETKDKVEIDRDNIRKSTKKWDTLDDEYDFGEPDEPEIMIFDDQETELSLYYTSISLYFILFGVLLVCVALCLISNWAVALSKAKQIGDTSNESKLLHS
eukprot:3215_1